MQSGLNKNVNVPVSTQAEFRKYSALAFMSEKRVTLMLNSLRLKQSVFLANPTYARMRLTNHKVTSCIE